MKTNELLGGNTYTQAMAWDLQERADRTNPYLLTTKKEGEKRMSEPTKEYLFAKAELCTKIARQQEERAEIAEALRNIERANRAMARIFNLEEEENE
jgi:hypothetical protein